MNIYIYMLNKEENGKQNIYEWIRKYIDIISKNPLACFDS